MAWNNRFILIFVYFFYALTQIKGAEVFWPCIKSKEGNGLLLSNFNFNHIGLIHQTTFDDGIEQYMGKDISLSSDIFSLMDSSPRFMLNDKWNSFYRNKVDEKQSVLFSISLQLLDKYHISNKFIYVNRFVTKKINIIDHGFLSYSDEQGPVFSIYSDSLFISRAFLDISKNYILKELEESSVKIKGENIFSLRNYSLSYREKNALRSLYKTFKKKGYYIKNDKDEIYQIISEHIDFTKWLGKSLSSEVMKYQDWYKFPALKGRYAIVSSDIVTLVEYEILHARVSPEKQLIIDVISVKKEASFREK